MRFRIAAKKPSSVYSIRNSGFAGSCGGCSPEPPAVAVVGGGCRIPAFVVGVAVVVGGGVLFWPLFVPLGL